MVDEILQHISHIPSHSRVVLYAVFPCECEGETGLSPSHHSPFTSGNAFILPSLTFTNAIIPHSPLTFHLQKRVYLPHSRSPSPHIIADFTFGTSTGLSLLHLLFLTMKNINQSPSKDMSICQSNDKQILSFSFYSISTSTDVIWIMWIARCEELWGDWSLAPSLSSKPWNISRSSRLFLGKVALKNEPNHSWLCLQWNGTQ